MFLNQVHFAWRDFGRPNGRRAALLLLAPLVLIALLLLPAVLATPPVTDHAALSGTGSSTGPELHLRGSYAVTISISGQAGCAYQVGIADSGYAYGAEQYSFPSWATTSQQRVSTWSVPDLADGQYTINTTATGCGPWTVTLDRPLDAG
jgi:hypothetical protein